MPRKKRPAPRVPRRRPGPRQPARKRAPRRAGQVGRFHRGRAYAGLHPGLRPVPRSSRQRQAGDGPLGRTGVGRVAAGARSGPLRHDPRPAVLDPGAGKGRGPGCGQGDLGGQRFQSQVRRRCRMDRRTAGIRSVLPQARRLEHGRPSGKGLRIVPGARRPGPQTAPAAHRGNLPSRCRPRVSRCGELLEMVLGPPRLPAPGPQDRGVRLQHAVFE